MDPHTNSTRLVLASNSPRRRELFRLLHVPFENITAEIDETPRPGEDPATMVRRLSQAKARAVATLIPGPALVVGSDTTVAFEGRVLGKPAGADDARRMLHDLRGHPHDVHTGVSIVDTGNAHEVVWSVSVVVWMRDYSDAEIEAYIASGDPFDKAGAYSIQHPGFVPVARIDGCYTNVMGMPLCELADRLTTFGLPVNPDVPAACIAYTGNGCPLVSTPEHGPTGR